MPATNRPGQTIRRQASADAGTRGERIDRHVAAALGRSGSACGSIPA